MSVETNKPFGIIYKATNSINGDAYVGQTIGTFKTRKKAHRGTSERDVDNYYFHNAIGQYGYENFKWEILKECNDGLMLDLMETFMIMVHHSHMSENGYNMNWGGDGNRGHIVSEDVKKTN